MVGTAPLRLRRIDSLDNLDEVDKILQVQKLHVNSPTEYLRGGMAERSKAADCKSADVRLRRFESSSPHQFNTTSRLSSAGRAHPW